MSDVPPRSDDRRLPFAIVAGLTIVVTVALYWPALGVGFLGDDFMILHRLRGIEHAVNQVFQLHAVHIVENIGWQRSGP